MRNLDINKVPSGEGEEEEEDHEWMTTTGSMEEEVEEEEGEWPAAAAAATNGGGGPPRKKLRLSKEQSRLLEESFRQNHTLNPVCISKYFYILVLPSIYLFYLFHPTYTSLILTLSLNYTI